MKNIEQIGNSADKGDIDADFHVHVHATFFSNDGQEEEKRVQKEANDTYDEEDVVPPGHSFRSRVVDL